MQDIVHDYVERMRQSPYIREKQFGNISSFNFTKSAFYHEHWNQLTTKARGLFINTATDQVVARGYDKFFNIGENRQTELQAIQKKVVYPVEVYQKENGFLGMISWDTEKKDLLFATKSMLTGEYVDILKNVFFHSGLDIEAVIKFLRSPPGLVGPCTLIVEVIDPQHDPHIIQYSQRQIVLLDIVLNELSPSYLAYHYVTNKAQDFRMPVKKHVKSILCFSEIEDLVVQCESPNCVDRDGLPFEGYVFRDANGYMFKLKTAFYRKWKQYRWQADAVIHKASDPGDDPFLQWVADHKEVLDGFSIIDMRRLYEAHSP